MKVRIETGDSEPTRGGAGAMGPKDPESVRPWGGDLETWGPGDLETVRREPGAGKGMR